MAKKTASKKTAAVKSGLPKGGFSKKAGYTGGSMAASNSATLVSQSPLYYDPRYSTPDKFYFPKDRATANSIWKNIYRTDATIAIATDMYAELPWSQFDLEGIDDPAIRKIYEDMFNDLNLVPKLPTFSRDYTITGELILHCLFNTNKGYWERAVSYNPDYVKIIGIGITAEQPLLWLKPTPEIKAFLNSPDPRVRKYLNSLSKEVVNAFRQNKEVPLDPLNTTYIPRLEVSHDVRGTSIYTRLYRSNMYEDFVMNASLATAQRNAAPIRLVKVGDPAGNWMPSDDDIQNMIELFSVAEADPLSAIFTHPHVSVDYVGVSDKVLLISREWEFIERIKLLALGVSKAFLVGETSFACFEKGTPVIRSNGTPTPIEDIQNGDLVLDQHGMPSKVVNNWCEGVPEKLVEISTWGGRKFRVTHNHRFPAWVWPSTCACGCGQKIETTGRAFVKEHAWKASGMRASGPLGIVSTKKTQNLIPCSAKIHEGRHRINTIPEGHNPQQIVMAGDLRKGDYLKIPLTSEQKIAAKDVNSDMARLLGYYLAEGSMSYYKSPSSKLCEMRLSFGKHERNTWVKDCQEICERLKVRCEVADWKQYGKERNSLTVRVIPKDKTFLEWFVKHAGQRSHSKCLSEDVLKWPVELQHELIKGYFRGDGSRKDKPSPAQKNRPKGSKSLAVVQLGTVSENLATQMVLLLTRLGFPVGHAVAYPKAPRKPYHILRIGGNAAVELCNLVWSQKLNAKTTTGVVWCDTEYMYIPITSVKEALNTQPVYNLEVEGSHTYQVCEGLATCNSAVAGLQNLMERLSQFRTRIEQDWMIKKLCQPVAEMHEFYAKSTSEVENRLKIERPEESKLIVPKIKWRKSLEPTQDASILGVWRDLKEIGILSDRTYANGAGIDLDVERRHLIEETEYKTKLNEKFPENEMKAASLKKAGRHVKRNYNPYSISAPKALDYTDFEYELEAAADSKNNIHIDEAMDILRKAGSEANSILKTIYNEHSGKQANLLTGV